MSDKKTYIINIDGMRADYFGIKGHQGSLTPTLEYLANHGIRFSNCKCILPAVTATNHTAILTSTNLQTHGIYGMGAHFQGLDFSHFRLYPRHGSASIDKYHHRHLQCLPTFFNVVKENKPKSKTAFVIGKYWVDFIADKSCDILIYGGNPKNPDYVTPSPGHILGGERHEGDSSFPPRVYLSKKEDSYVSPPKGTFALPQLATADIVPSDKWIIDQAIQTICQHDPDFMYILLNNVDTAGHIYGAFTDLNTSNLNNFINPDAMKDQLYITDCQVKRFIEFLETREILHNSRIIITSDHGMSTMKEVNKSTDVRKILTEHGIKIRANTSWRLFGYNDKGDYDWCSSEGLAVYIFCREDIEQEIKNILTEYLPNYHEILDKDAQEKKKMWKESYDDVVWPRLIVFLDKNYGNSFYGDALAAGGKMLAKLPPYIKLFIAKLPNLSGLPGNHGTSFEQDVPLIIYSPSEANVAKGIIDDREVSVIDIIPTINYLNGWPNQPTFEGKSLLPIIKTEDSKTSKKIKRKR